MRASFCGNVDVGPLVRDSVYGAVNDTSSMNMADGFFLKSAIEPILFSLVDIEFMRAHFPGMMSHG